MIKQVRMNLKELTQGLWLMDESAWTVHQAPCPK